MQITKIIFDTIKPNEIFRVVTTGYHTITDYDGTILTFVCQKGKSGTDWIINYNPGSATPDDIARYGDKVHDVESIFSICPCNAEVMELYRK